MLFILSAEYFHDVERLNGKFFPKTWLHELQACFLEMTVDVLKFAKIDETLSAARS